MAARLLCELILECGRAVVGNSKRRCASRMASRKKESRASHGRRKAQAVTDNGCGVATVIATWRLLYAARDYLAGSTDSSSVTFEKKGRRRRVTVKVSELPQWSPSMKGRCKTGRWEAVKGRTVAVLSTA